MGPANLKRKNEKSAGIWSSILPEREKEKGARGKARIKLAKKSTELRLNFLGSSGC
jgi:hypothetical protein